MKRIKTILAVLCLLLAAMVSLAVFAACENGGEPDPTPGPEPAGKSENSITGLVDKAAVCGDAFPALNAVAEYGQIVYTVAARDGDTAEAELSYAALPATVTVGEYVIRAAVEETEEYKGAVAYADLTVTHQAYADIGGEPVETVVPDAAAKTKGYSVKECACGEEVHGDETVIVTFTVDGQAADTKIVPVGGNIGTIDTSKLPVRNGYAATLYEGDKPYTGGGTVTDFTEVQLSARWVQVQTFAYSSDSYPVGVGWMFNAEGPLKDNAALCTVAYTADGITAVAQYLGDVEHDENTMNEDTGERRWAESPAELTLGTLPFGEYRTIRFTFSSTQGGYVYFGDHLESAYVYTDAAADAGKTVIVEVGVDDGVAYVSIDGRRSEYPDWTQHDLNALPFRVFDKNIADREVFAHTGERYTYKIGNPTVEYNYLQEADTILAGLPAAADVYNAEQIHADILALEQIRDSHFSDAEKTAYAEEFAAAAALKQAAEKIMGDHLAIAARMAEELPAFETMLTATKEEQDKAYAALAKYLAYVNVKFTAEEAAEYEEPAKISFYRRFFASDAALRIDVNADTVTSMERWQSGSSSYPERFSLNNASVEVSFPQIAFGAYESITIKYQMGSENANWTIKYGSLTYKGQKTNTAEFCITKEADGYYLTLSAEYAVDRGQKVKLDDAVVLGSEGLTFTLTNDAWGWVWVYNNTVAATLSNTDAANVYIVTYNYMSDAGSRQQIQYYLADGALDLPEVGATYKDVVGTHTFLGFFAEGSEVAAKDGDTVNSDFVLTAKYEVREGDYTEYTVLFFDDEEGEVMESETRTVHYGDTLQLPAEAPAKTTELPDHHYEFVGWFDLTGKQYFGGESIEGDLELYAHFNLVQDLQYTVTLTSLAGADETYSVYGGGTFTRPEQDPVRAGYDFAGWYTENGEPFDFAAEVNNDTTLVAKWKVWAPLTAKTVRLSDTIAEELTSPTTVHEPDAGNSNPVRWVLSGANDNTYHFVMPAIDYRPYSEVRVVLHFGQANSQYIFRSGDISLTVGTTDKIELKVRYIGADAMPAGVTGGEGYYLDAYYWDCSEDEHQYVKLSDAVIAGKQGVEFSIETVGSGGVSAWDWMKLRSEVEDAQILEGVLVREYIDSTACTLTESSTEEEYRSYLERVADFTAYEKEHYEEPAIVQTLREKYDAASSGMI